MIRIFRPFIVVALLALPASAQADDVLDALDAARDAYVDGDTSFAAEELEFALDLIREMKTGDLAAFLPDAPDGWTKNIEEDTALGLAIMGGVAAVASYTNGDDDISITLASENQMAMSMGVLVANPALSGGKRIRIGRERMMRANDQIIGMVDDRILVMAEGDNLDDVQALLEQIDFDELADFGQ